MSESYSESSSYVAGLTLPVDGELASMATLKPVLTRIADRTKFFLDRIRGVASYTETIPMTFGQTANPDASPHWAWTGADGTPSWRQLTLDGRLTFGLYLPKGDGAVKIVSAKIYFFPNTGRAGVPATQPIFSLHRLPKNSITPTQIATVQLAAGSVGAYEVEQTLELVAVNHVILTTDTYYLLFKGEAGANGQVGASGTLVKGLELVTAPS